MFGIKYEKNNKQFEELLELENSLLDKIKYSYILWLEKKGKITNLQVILW